MASMRRCTGGKLSKLERRRPMSPKASPDERPKQRKEPPAPHSSGHNGKAQDTAAAIEEELRAEAAREAERRERERRKLSEVASQDSALFQLLGRSLAPYKKWLIAALFLMLGTSALNAVPPYLLQQ